MSNSTVNNQTGWRAALYDRLTMSSQTKNKVKDAAKIVGKAALVLGIVSLVAGVALGAYMLITKTSFTTLGKNIKAFWDTKNSWSNGQFFGVVGVTAGAVVTVFLVVKAAKPVKDAAMKKINKQRENFRTWQYNRALAASQQRLPENTPRWRRTALQANAEYRLQRLNEIERINGRELTAGHGSGDTILALTENEDRTTDILNNY